MEESKHLVQVNDEEEQYKEKFKMAFKKGFKKEVMAELISPYIQDLDEKEQKAVFSRLLKYPDNDLEGELKTLDALK